MLGELETDAEVECVLHPEGEPDGESVPLTVRVSESVPQDDADWERVPLAEKLLLDVEHMLGEVETDAEVEIEPHSDGEVDRDLARLAVALALGLTKVDSVSLTVGDREPLKQAVEDCEMLVVSEMVPHRETDSESVPLEERLPLDVGHRLGDAKPDSVAECEPKPEGDISSESVPLTVCVSDTVEQSVGVCEALIEGEREGVAVEHPEADREGELLALWLA